MYWEVAQAPEAVTVTAACVFVNVTTAVSVTVTDAVLVMVEPPTLLGTELVGASSVSPLPVAVSLPPADLVTVTTWPGRVLVMYVGGAVMVTTPAGAVLVMVSPGTVLRIVVPAEMVEVT